MKGIEDFQYDVNIAVFTQVSAYRKWIQLALSDDKVRTSGTVCNWIHMSFILIHVGILQMIDIRSTYSSNDA